MTMSSFGPKKNNEISVLASMKRPDLKNKDTLYNLLLAAINHNYIIQFYDLNSFQRLGQKSLKKFHWFFGPNDDTKKSFRN